MYFIQTFYFNQRFWLILLQLTTTTNAYPSTFLGYAKDSQSGHRNFNLVDASFSLLPRIGTCWHLRTNWFIFLIKNSNLKEDELSFNSIQLTERTRLGKLHSLSVEQNLIDIIPNHALNYMKSLKELNLANNRISEVSKHVFFGVLDISGN